MRWTMKRAMSLELNDLLKMKKEERAELAQFFQNMYKRRVAQAKKAGIEPYGITHIREQFEKRNLGIAVDTPILKNGKLTPEWERLNFPHNTLTAYNSMMQDFFTWKSNTVKGWRDLRLKESIGLFGREWIKDEKGHRHLVPRHILTEEERKQFWKLYHELLNREANNILPSETKGTNYEKIKEYGLASMWLKMREKRDLADMDLTSLVLSMEESLKENKVKFVEHAEDMSKPGDGNDPTIGEDVLDTNDAFA